MQYDRRRSEREKELRNREKYERYIDQMAWRYVREGEDDFAGWHSAAQARRDHPYEDYWPGKE